MREGGTGTVGKPQRGERKQRVVDGNKVGKDAEHGAFGILVSAEKAKGTKTPFIQDGSRHRLTVFVQKTDEAGTRAFFTQMTRILYTRP